MKAHEYARYNWGTAINIPTALKGTVQMWQSAKTATGEQVPDVEEVYCEIPAIQVAQMIGTAVRNRDFAAMLTLANNGVIDARDGAIGCYPDLDSEVPQVTVRVAGLIDVALDLAQVEDLIANLTSARDELPPPIEVPEDVVIRIESDITYTQPINNVHEMLEHDERFRDGKWFGILADLHNKVLSHVDDNIDDYSIEWAGVRGNISIESEGHLDTYLDDDDWAT